jgi:hypothetical protein
MNLWLADFYLLPAINYWMDDKWFPPTTHIRDLNHDNEDKQFESMAETMSPN